MKKKIISIAVLSAIILTTLVGCGNKKGEVSETTEPTTEISTEAITDAPTTASTETPVTELKKGNITVTGDFGQATKVDVNELTDSNEYKSIEENLGDLITSFSCYDISISTADGKTVQPEGTVNVTVKLSDELKVANGNSYAVFYTDGNKIAKVESSVNGDELTFKTTHFSVYTVVKYSSEDKVANATFSNIPNDGVGEMVEINTIKHEHSYNDVVTKEATCTENGVKTFSCECGDSYTKEIGATGHNFGSYTYNNDASYEADGTETATCSVCGATDTRTKSGTKLVKKEEPTPSNNGGWTEPSWYYNEDGRIMSDWIKGEDGVYRPTGETMDLSAWYGKTLAEYEAATGVTLGTSFPDGSGIMIWPDGWQNYVIGTKAIINVYLNGNSYTSKVQLTF